LTTPLADIPAYISLMARISSILRTWRPSPPTSLTPSAGSGTGTLNLTPPDDVTAARQRTV